LGCHRYRLALIFENLLLEHTNVELVTWLFAGVKMKLLHLCVCLHLCFQLHHQSSLIYFNNFCCYHVKEHLFRQSKMQWNRKLAEIGSKPRVGIQIMMSVEFLFQPPLVTNMKLEYELVEPQTWGEPTRQETLEKVIHPLLTFSSRQFWTHRSPQRYECKSDPELWWCLSLS